ncbi:hypothetical protein E1B28_010789 [Marasmius oreades]|uniref:Uncharacterized protein n=1 Tax=Marasmius oreades TaxID=181124 RepID=A0A9P7RTH3_9AGAR|nr:uncharacterized protein E1B28_010789 [Marasmius oreades]KAG7089080.1 hypothetical protein E1B28_010789 [Marasmius oreades]
MLLLLNSLAKYFSLVPDRTETILLIAVYINFDLENSKSTEITHLSNTTVPKPSHDYDPVQMFRYETELPIFYMSCSNY